MNWLKWIAVSALVLSVTVGVVLITDAGGSAGAQTVPSGQAEALIAQRSGLSLDTIHKLEAAYLAAAADKGAAKGVLGPDQANKLRNLTLGPVFDRLLQGVSQASGTPATELVESVSRGQSLAEIAAAKGVPREVLKTRLTAQLQAELTIQQSAGLVTPVQAAVISGAFNANLDRIVDASHAGHTRSR